MNATLGLAVLGYPLVFLGMASLMARVSTPVGYVLIAAGLVSLGLAVSASPRRSRLPWAEGLGLVVLGLAVWGGGLAAWLYGAILFMGMAYLAYGVALFVDAHHPLKRLQVPSGWWHFTRH